MTRSSLTEETPAAPGWVDRRIGEIFAPLGPDAVAARDAYAECLAGSRGGVDVDASHDRCRRAALQALDGRADVGALDLALQALEAELSNAT